MASDNNIHGKAAPIGRTRSTTAVRHNRSGRQLYRTPIGGSAEFPDAGIHRTASNGVHLNSKRCR
jgi:hypothetical protein